VPDVTTRTAPQALRAAADDILALHEDGRYEAALAACDDLVARATDLDDPVVRESAFTARFERAALLAELGDLAEAAGSALAAAEDLPFDRDDPDQTHELAMLLVHAGTCFGAAGHPLAALTTYDRLAADLGSAADHPVTRAQVIRGRVNRAVSLHALGRHDDAIAAALDLAAELDGADPVQAEQLGMAHRVRAAAARALDRHEDAVVALAQAETLAAVGDADVRAQVAAAQVERAELLAELGRPDEAVEVLEATVGRLTDERALVAELRRVEADLLDRLGQHDRAAAVRAGV
jgi:tetratricopeptide (TPR) repeat protein